jgi:DnaK suppressor protein
MPRTARAASPAPGAATKVKGVGSRAHIKFVLDDLVVAEGEPGWTLEEMEEVVGDLRAQHARVSRILGDLEREVAGLMRDSGDGAGADQADVGASTLERDQELTLVNAEREVLEQIERAVEHIESGKYGVCDGCGNAIGKMRLMAFPRATLCLSCKQREERR